VIGDQQPFWTEKL